jgi:exonuclease VII large subunit
LVCLALGAGVEHLRLWLATEPEELPVLVADGVRLAGGGARPKTVVVRDEAAERAAESLRVRVAELQKALAAREAELAALKQNTSEEPQASRRPRREEFRQRMEQLKRENPQQFAEMEKRREEFHQKMEQEKQSQSDFLAAIGSQSMSETQRENHDKLMESLAKIDALRAQREQSGAEPGTEADAAFHQTMRESMAELGALYEVERTYLLEQAAAAAGYEGDDASKFVDYIQRAVQSTTLQGGPGGGPPPGL